MQGCVLPARWTDERLARLAVVQGGELFGPVATVYKASSEEQAVELTNDTPFELGSYVFTTDKERAKRAAALRQVVTASSL